MGLNGLIGGLIGGEIGGAGGWVVGSLMGQSLDRQEDEAERSRRDSSYSYTPNQRGERSVTLNESQLMEVCKMVIAKCKEGRELEAVVFECPESSTDYMVTLKYKPAEVKV